MPQRNGAREDIDTISGTWNNDEFETYRPGKLKACFTDPKQNYVFILLKDDDGKTVALASFNAPEDKSQLRILNFTVARDHRDDLHVSRQLSREIMAYAMDNGLDKSVIRCPLSSYSVTEGNDREYANLCKRYGAKAEPKTVNGQTELWVDPLPLDQLHERDATHREQVTRRKARQSASNPDNSPA